jgi:predicted dehydrogenase
MERLRFCLIGAGRAGMVHARNITNIIGSAELTAIVDSGKELLEKSAAELRVKNTFLYAEDALSSDLFDAVIIGAPTFTHRDLAVKCAEAGKHVFCEKPMTLTVEDAEQMISAADRKGVKLQVGFMRRFDPLFLQAKQMIDSGSLGEPIIIKSNARGPGLPAPWYYDVSRSNGLLAEMCSHDFDSARWMGGGNFRRIYAEAVNRKTPEIRKDYPDFYDSVACIFRLDNDVIGTIDSTCPADYGFDVRGEIVLTKGLITIGELKDQSIVSCDAGGALKSSAFRSWRNRFREAYVAEITSFIESVLRDAAPAVTGYDGLAAVEAVVAGNQSIKSGTPVEL